MRDLEFLIWLHERLEHVHGENPSVDYMWKLRSIMTAMDPEKITLNSTSMSLAMIVEQAGYRGYKAAKGKIHGV